MLKSLIFIPFRIGRALFWAGLWLFSLGLWAWYPLRWWPGDNLLPVQLLNYIMPWLLVGLVPGLLVAGFARRNRLLLTLAVPTLAIILSYAPLFLPRTRFVSADSHSLKVMSYNVWVYNRNIPAIATVIRQEQPDILLLQELSPRIVLELKRLLADLYPGQELYFAYDVDKYQGVVSRYPLTPNEGSPHQGRTQKVWVDTPGGRIQVWNVHLSQPIVWRKHTQQVDILTQAVAKVNEPLIMGGDFNTTDQSEMYGYLNEQLKNAHWEAGWGFGFSFPASERTFKRLLTLPTPLIRIDHFFHNDSFFVKKAGTLSDSGGSDHLPIVAEFLLVK
jgi:endonuclease/exonuclease/phosphatase (EEP) superfamily protein YafD